MRLLLDTHTLIWFLDGDDRLSENARSAIESPSNDKYISLASGWEMAIKTDLGKLVLPISFEELFPTRLEILGGVKFEVQHQGAKVLPWTITTNI